MPKLASKRTIWLQCAKIFFSFGLHISEEPFISVGTKVQLLFSEEIISRRSLCIMVYYMYSGKLPQSGNRQERDEDLIAADYLGIDRLMCHSATI